MYSGKVILPFVRNALGGSTNELVSAVKNSRKSTSNRFPGPVQYAKYNSYHTIFRTPRLLGYNKSACSSEFRNYSFENKHVPNENEHAHRIMRSIPAYEKSTMDLSGLMEMLPSIDHINSPPPLPGVNWHALEPAAIAGSFVGFSKEFSTLNVDLCAPQYSGLINALVESVPSLSDRLLTEVLTALTLWQDIETFQYSNDASNVSILWKQLDDECLKRIRNWSIEETFKICDLWYKLKLSRLGYFTKKMLINLAPNIPECKPHQIVQFLFYVNICREAPPNFSRKRFESVLLKIIDEISLEELGIVAMAFFKSKSLLCSDELIDKIFDRLSHDDLTMMSDICLSASFKLLRSVSHTSRLDKVYLFMESTIPHIQDMSLQAQLHLALIGTSSLVFNHKVVDSVSKNFIERVEELRLKDIERFCLILKLYNYIPASHKNILSVFSNNMRSGSKIDEMRMYPKSFISCVNYMTIMQFMPVDLISIALNPQMVEYSQSVSENYADLGREILELDCIMELEGSHFYKGNRLSTSKKQEFLQHYVKRNRDPTKVTFSHQTHQERLLLTVEARLKTLLNVDLMLNFILPYIPIPDVVFCVTPNGEPVDLPKEYKDQKELSNKLPLPAGLRYVAVVLAGRNSYVRGTKRLRGSMEMKMRHLKILGYEVVLVDFYQFSQGGVKTKFSYLNEILSKILSQNPTRLETAIENYRKSEKPKNLLQSKEK